MPFSVRTHLSPSPYQAPVDPGRWYGLGDTLITVHDNWVRMRDLCGKAVDDKICPRVERQVVIVVAD